MTKLRIALAQVNATVGDLDGNAELIVALTCANAILSFVTLQA